jgi:hypothetical protein
MPKKKNQESPAAQSKRFVESARELEAAGELNLTAAATGLKRVVGNLRPKKASKKKRRTK